MLYKMYICIFLLLALCSTALPVLSQPGQAIELLDTPAGRQLSAYIAAVNSCDAKVMRSFLETHTSESVLQRIPVDRLADMERKMFEDFGGYELRRVLESKEHRVRVLFKAKKGQLIDFTLDVEQSSPYKIIGIVIQPAQQEGNGDKPPPMQQATPPPPDENAPVFRRLKEFISIINAGGKRTAMRSFAQENF